MIGRYLDRTNGLGGILRALGRFRRLVVGGTLVFPVLVLLSDKAFGAILGDTASIALQVTFAILGAICALALLVFDPTNDRIAQIATDALAELEACRGQLGLATRNRQALAALYSVANVTWDALSDVIESGFRDGFSARDVATIALDAIVEQRRLLFGIADGEAWSIAVYQLVNGSLVATTWKRSWAGGDTPREWQPGEGHVGLAFSKELALVHPDIAKDLAFQAPAAKWRDYDKDRYRSIASVPIINLDKRCLGIVTATSSMPGRLDEASVEVLSQAADTLACVLTAQEILYARPKQEG